MITAPPPKIYPIPAEGRYTLRIEIIKQKPQVMTKYGARDKIAFGFEVTGTDNGEGKPMMVWQEYYAALGKSRKPSKLANFIEKVLGRKLTEEDFRAFDENQLLKKTVEAEIVHNATEDRTFANIDEFLRNRTRGATRSVEDEDVSRSEGQRAREMASYGERQPHEDDDDVPF